MSEIIHTNASHDTIRKVVVGLPQGLLGGGPESDEIMTRVAMVLLGRIKQAFVVKARGGTDDAGDRWAPLKPSTIAYSRTRSRGRGGRTSAERGGNARPSRALSGTQQERWWELYRQGLAIHHGQDGAKGRAARRAWGILKAEGAQTLFDKYAHRQVEILRDTGLLLNSLSPGSNSGHQIVRVGNGSVTVGTNRKWAACHHYGVPGRIPQRRLWPAPTNWPAAWWSDILDELRAGVGRMLAAGVRGAS